MSGAGGPSGPVDRDENLLPLRTSLPTGTRPPLFLVAAPGVNALGYTAVARLLPEDQPVYVVQSRKRGRRFPTDGVRRDGTDAYPRVAAEYLASVRAVAPRGPYQLAGMCDGALIAFQMARQLEAAGERVGLLAVLDTWPLENTSIYPLVRIKIRARSWVKRTDEGRRRVLRRKVGEAVEIGERLVRPRPPPTPEAEAEARQAELRAKKMTWWRAKLWPGAGFQPAVVDAPIAVLRVQKQPYWRIRDDALAWRTRTRGVVTIHILPGGHESWMKPPNVATVARTIGAYLDHGPDAAPGPGLRRKRTSAEAEPDDAAAAPEEQAGDAGTIGARLRRALWTLLEKVAGGDEEQ